MQPSGLPSPLAFSFRETDCPQTGAFCFCILCPPPWGSALALFPFFHHLHLHLPNNLGSPRNCHRRLRNYRTNRHRPVCQHDQSGKVLFVTVVTVGIGLLTVIRFVVVLYFQHTADWKKKILNFRNDRRHLRNFHAILYRLVFSTLPRVDKNELS